MVKSSKDLESYGETIEKASGKHKEECKPTVIKQQQKAKQEQPLSQQRKGSEGIAIVIRQPGSGEVPARWCVSEKLLHKHACNARLTNNPSVPKWHATVDCSGQPKPRPLKHVVASLSGQSLRSCGNWAANVHIAEALSISITLGQDPTAECYFAAGVSVKEVWEGLLDKVREVDIEEQVSERSRVIFKPPGGLGLPACWVAPRARLVELEHTSGQQEKLQKLNTWSFTANLAFFPTRAGQQEHGAITLGGRQLLARCGYAEEICQAWYDHTYLERPLETKGRSFTANTPIRELLEHVAPGIDWSEGGRRVRGQSEARPERALPSADAPAGPKSSPHPMSTPHANRSKPGVRSQLGQDVLPKGPAAARRAKRADSSSSSEDFDSEESDGEQAPSVLPHTAIKPPVRTAQASQATQQGRTSEQQGHASAAAQRAPASSSGSSSDSSCSSSDESNSEDFEDEEPQRVPPRSGIHPAAHTVQARQAVHQERASKQQAPQARAPAAAQRTPAPPARAAPAPAPMRTAATRGSQPAPALAKEQAGTGHATSTGSEEEQPIKVFFYVASRARTFHALWLNCGEAVAALAQKGQDWERALSRQPQLGGLFQTCEGPSYVPESNKPVMDGMSLVKYMGSKDWLSRMKLGQQVTRLGATVPIATPLGEALMTLVPAAQAALQAEEARAKARKEQRRGRLPPDNNDVPAARKTVPGQAATPHASGHAAAGPATQRKRQRQQDQGQRGDSAEDLPVAVRRKTAGPSATPMGVGRATQQGMDAGPGKGRSQSQPARATAAPHHKGPQEMARLHTAGRDAKPAGAGTKQKVTIALSSSSDSSSSEEEGEGRGRPGGHGMPQLPDLVYERGSSRLTMASEAAATTAIGALLAHLNAGTAVDDFWTRFDSHYATADGVTREFARGYLRLRDCVRAGEPRAVKDVLRRSFGLQV